MSYIEIKGVTKFFEDGRQILKGINMSIEKGEFITLLGSSGCGKTTLLRSIAGLTGIDSGSIIIDGRDLSGVSPGKRNLAMIFQQYSLFPAMSVYDNIAYGLRLKKMPRPEIDQKVKDALKLIEMEGFEKSYPAQLSGGEQQRVSLARGLVMGPKVLLMDEPFSAIDAKLRKALQIRIRNIHTALGITTIFVTHDQEEAMRMSDRIYLMHDGRIEQSGTPMELYLEPRTAYAAGFIGHYNMIDGASWANAGFAEDSTGCYAFRPENIALSSRPFESGGGCILADGSVEQIIYQGNVVRYTIKTRSGLKLDADRLYEGETPFSRGDRVFLSIEKQDISHYLK